MLTDTEAELAVAYNQRRQIIPEEIFGMITPCDDTPKRHWTKALVQSVARWQLHHDLHPDGMVGPRTKAAILEACAPEGGAIVSDTSASLPQVLPVPNIAWANWRQDSGIKHLATRRRTRARVSVSEIVVHEPVARSLEDTQDILARRGLGVHLMIDFDGSVTQHADLGSEITYHLPKHNVHSVGIEVINPYKPKYAPGAPAIDDAPWAHGDSYVLPTLEQCVTMHRLVTWLTDTLNIPLVHHGSPDGERFYLHQIPGEGRDLRDPKPGIWAHQHVGAHSDGAFPLLVDWLTRTTGEPVEDCYRIAIALATGARRWVKP